MARARLHVICGNCGCNSEWELRILRDFDDVTDRLSKFEDAAHMVCGNCSTIHDLKDSVKSPAPEVCSDGGKCGAGGYCITCPNMPAPEGDK